MSINDLQDFRQLVLQDLELQRELKNLADREEFIKKTIDLGERSGFEFSREEIESELRKNRRLWHERWI